MGKKRVAIDDKADEILRIAEQSGVEQEYFFKKHFEIYQTQLKILKDLKKIIDSEETLVTKEYVKGRENIYTHPAITEFNRTSTAINQTVQTLIKIITTLRENTEESDELLDFLRGR